MQSGPEQAQFNLTEYWLIFRQELFLIYKDANIQAEKSELIQFAKELFDEKDFDATAFVHDILTDPKVDILTGKKIKDDGIILSASPHVPVGAKNEPPLSVGDQRRFLRFFFYGMRMVLVGVTLEDAYNKQSIADKLEALRDSMLADGIPPIHHPIAFGMAQTYAAHLTRFIEKRIQSTSRILRTFMYGQKYLDRAKDERLVVQQAIAAYQLSLLPDPPDVTRAKRLVSALIESVPWLGNFDGFFFQHVSTFVGRQQPVPKEIDRAETEADYSLYAWGYWLLWGNADKGANAEQCMVPLPEAEELGPLAFLQPIKIRLDLLESLIQDLTGFMKQLQQQQDLHKGFALLSLSDDVNGKGGAASAISKIDATNLSDSVAEFHMMRDRAKDCDHQDTDIDDAELRLKCEEAACILTILNAQSEFYKWLFEQIRIKPEIDAFTHAYFALVQKQFQQMIQSWQIYRKLKPKDTKLQVLQDCIPTPNKYFESWCKEFNSALSSPQLLLHQYRPPSSSSNQLASDEPKQEGRLRSWLRNKFQ